jgi:hypothetical protein|tara:strand:+ start:280 stop:1059 length:780 start_codon:yes stop_codon:yes gene_type:complete
MNEIETIHAALTTVAQNQGCTSSKLVGTVSRHILPPTASFYNVSALHSKAHTSSTSAAVLQRTFLATSESSLVFSARFETVTTKTPIDVEPKPLSADPMLSASNGKRKRNMHEDQEEAVSRAKKRLSSVNSPELESELETAQAVIERVLTLRGPMGEVLVQSYAILTKKLKPTDASMSVVIAIRLNAGIPVSVASIKRSLGPCWKDGVVSSTNSVNGVCDRDLPLTEEGKASKRMGNDPMLIVTSIPKLSTPPRSSAVS